MTQLDDFKKLGFDITWKLISFGYISNSVFSNELMIDDIMDYAVNLYENESTNKLLLDLIVLEKDDSQNIFNAIQKLSDKERTDDSLEYKKWEILFVWKKAWFTDQNYMDFLLDLSDLWTKLGCPKNFPRVIQGINNDMNPEDYYSLQNYHTVIQEMKQWIIHEKNMVNSFSADMPE